MAAVTMAPVGPWHRLLMARALRATRSRSNQGRSSPSTQLVQNRLVSSRRCSVGLRLVPEVAGTRAELQPDRLAGPESDPTDRGPVAPLVDDLPVDPGGPQDQEIGGAADDHPVRVDLEPAGHPAEVEPGGELDDRRSPSPSNTRWRSDRPARRPVRPSEVSRKSVTVNSRNRVSRTSERSR